ncbi:MAG TPA: hypothetical protein VFR86_06700 [Burkholderiaceae bacterium]|nr:hypothetical protein [Burkholderiaceae bacterium]
MLETIMIGPWLMVDLPLGIYSVEAAFEGQMQRGTTQIHPGDHHQMIMYFDTPADVSPDWVKPFEVSPYLGK